MALKVIAPKTGWTEESLDRFRREIETIARLSHPNIVTAFDAAVVDGIQFLAMEHISGTDLARLVRERGPLSVEQAVEVILQAARGLEHAHAKGIIHRDIFNGLMRAKNTRHRWLAPFRSKRRSSVVRPAESDYQG